MSEFKYYDTSKSASVVAPTSWAGTELDPATINCLVAPTQGFGASNRTGRKYYVHSIRILGSIVSVAQTDQTQAETQAKVRLILYQDKQSNGTQSQGEDLMSAGGLGTSDGTINGFENMDNYGRFCVLGDQFFTFPQPTMVYDGVNIEQGGQTQHFEFFVEFDKPVRVSCNAAGGGTVADIVDNSFHLIGCTNNSAVGHVVKYNSRVIFFDP